MLAVVLRTSRPLFFVCLAKGNTPGRGAPHRQWVAAQESKDVPPWLDPTCISSSKHQITEEGNSQFAWQITHVASTGEASRFVYVGSLRMIPIANSKRALGWSSSAGDAMWRRLWGAPPWPAWPSTPPKSIACGREATGEGGHSSPAPASSPWTGHRSRGDLPGWLLWRLLARRVLRLLGTPAWESLLPAWRKTSSSGAPTWGL